MPTYFMKTLYVSGFKSFSVESPQTFIFGEGFNVISGPNGAGKSNVIDAISFALTVPETELRVQKLRQLLHVKGSVPDPSATVELTFAAKGDGSDQHTVTARLFKDSDERRYKWQGRNKTQQEVRRCLRLLGLDVERPSFLVFQNTATSFLTQSPQSLAAHVLRASGGAQYAEAVAGGKQFVDGKLRGTMGRIDAALETARLNAAVDREQLQRLTRLHELERSIEATRRETDLAGCAAVAQGLADAERQLGTAKEELAVVEAEAAEAAEAAARWSAAVASAADQRKAVGADAAEAEKRAAALKRKVVQLGDGVGSCQEALQAARARRERQMIDRASRADAVAGWRAELAAAERSDARLTAEQLRLSMELAAAETALSGGGLDSVRVGRAAVAEAEADARRAAGAAKSAASERGAAERAMRQAADELADARWHAGEARARLGADSAAQLRAAESRAAEAARKVTQLQRRVSDLRKVAETGCFGGRRLCQAGLGLIIDLVELRPAAEGWLDALEVAGRGRWFNEACCTRAEAEEVLQAAKRSRRMVTIWVVPDLPPPDAATGERVQRAVRSHRAVSPADLVAVEPRLSRIVRALFRGCVLVPGSDEAERVSRELGLDAVTRAGLLFHAGGRSLSGGARGASASSLEAKWEAAAAAPRLAEMEDTLHALTRQRDADAAAAKELAAPVAEQQKLDAALMAASETELLCRRRLADAECRAADAAAEEALRRGRAARLLARVEAAAKASSAEEAARAAVAALQDQTAKVGAECGEVRCKVRQLRDRVAAAEAAAGLADGPSSQDEDALQEQLDSAIAQRAEAEAALRSAADRVSRSDEKAAESRRKADEAEREAERCSKVADGLAKRRAAAQKRVAELSASVDKFAGERESLPKEALSKLPPTKWEKPPAAVLKELQAESMKLEAERRALQRLTSKTTGAKADLAQLEAKAAQLATWEEQAAVLRKGAAALAELLSDGAAAAAAESINDAALDVIARESFQKYYSMLHPSKSVQILKTAPDGPVAAGIEVEVRGDGEKQALSMLSGGQKTLMSLSLVFGIAAFRRSPFYALDEVDAALDEGNRLRLAGLIRAMFAEQQVVCVSHHSAMQQHADTALHLESRGGWSELTKTVVLRRNDASGAKRARLGAP